MTRIALVAALAALLLFAALAARLRPRVGPAAGLLQAALLALFLSLAGAFLALRVVEAPAGAARSLIVLADADAARRDPDGGARRTRAPAQGRAHPARALRAARRGVRRPASPRRRRACSPRPASPRSTPRSAGRRSRPPADSLPEVLVLGGRAEAARRPRGADADPAPAAGAGPARPHRPAASRAAGLHGAAGHGPRPGADAGRSLDAHAAASTTGPRDARAAEGASEETAEVAFTFPAGRPGAHRLLLELAGEDGGVIDREYGECAVQPLPAPGVRRAGGCGGPPGAAARRFRLPARARQPRGARGREAPRRGGSSSSSRTSPPRSSPGRRSRRSRAPRPGRGAACSSSAARAASPRGATGTPRWSACCR